MVHLLCWLINFTLFFLLTVPSIVHAGNTTCVGSQLDWYTSAVGESPCMTYQRLRQICDSQYQVPSFRDTTPGDNCDTQLNSCCCNSISWALSMLCMNCQQDVDGGSPNGIDAGVGAYQMYLTDGTMCPSTNQSLPSDIQTAACNAGIKLDDFLYNLFWGNGAWYYVYTSETAQEDQIANNNNTFSHCSNAVPATSSSPKPATSPSPSPSPSSPSTSQPATPLTLPISQSTQVSSPSTSQSSQASSISTSQSPQALSPSTSQPPQASSPPTPQSPHASSPPTVLNTVKKSNMGTIVGCAVGGAALIAVLLAAACFLRRRRRRRGSGIVAPASNFGPPLARAQYSSGSFMPVTMFDRVPSSTNLMDQNSQMQPSSGFNRNAPSSYFASYTPEQAVQEDFVSLLKPNRLGSAPLDHTYSPEELRREGSSSEEPRGEEPRRVEPQREEDARTLISSSGQTYTSVPPPYNPAWDIFQRQNEAQALAQGPLTENKD